LDEAAWSIKSAHVMPRQLCGDERVIRTQRNERGGVTS
jgi:hypothetical protein